MADYGSLEKLYEKITRGDEVRQSLIAVRGKISDESLRRKFMILLGGDFSVLEGLLEDPDPKVRKNAALILGKTDDEDVLPSLLGAWKKETTLFIREDYLKAMENLDYEPYLPELRKRLDEIESGSREQDSQDTGTGAAGAAGNKASALWDNGKHLAEEAGRIRRMLLRYEKKTASHTFSRICPAPDLMLVCNRAQVHATAEQIRTGMVKEQSGGVHVRGGDMRELMKIRTWSECLLLIPGARPIPADGKKAAEKLHEMRLCGFLKYLHDGQDGPYRYRIQLKGKRIPEDKKGTLIRAISSRLDLLEKGQLTGSDSDYEIELRLIERSDGTLAPMIRLFTLKDERFSYRKAVTAQSMSPVNAALVMRLARPYLREKAQVLDPFCGTGTLLIEREVVLQPGPLYGVDKFGDAVRKARENTDAFLREAARQKGQGTDLFGLSEREENEPAAVRSDRLRPINYINRDFFDFTHDYLFDELITELPDPAGEQADEFMKHFVEKSLTLLKDGARMVVVTRRPEALERASEAAGLAVKDRFLLNERLNQKAEIIIK